MNIKYSLIGFLYLTCQCLYHNVFSQLQVDAGNDTTLCADAYTNSLIIGTNAKIENGIEPYTIAWECEIIPYGILNKRTASDILNDSTLLSPTIIDGAWVYTSKLDFVLNVADSIGNFASDSITIGFSTCAYILGYSVIFLNQGDSVWIDAGTPFGDIVTLRWCPSYGLSSPDSSATWCKPDKTTDYSIVYKNIFGCECMQHTYEVRVSPNGIDGFNFGQGEFLNPRQVGSKVYFNNRNNQEASVSISNLKAESISNMITFKDYIELNSLLSVKGIYIVNILIGNRSESCKVIF